MIRNIQISLIYLIILINFQFMMLMELDSTRKTIFTLVITLILFILELVYNLSLHQRKIIQTTRKNFVTFIILLLFVVTLGYIYSILIYPMQTLEILAKYLRWLILLLYFPLSNIVQKKNFIIKFFILINIITNFLLIIQSFILQRGGGLFLAINHVISENGSLVIDIRNGQLRLTSLAFVTLIALCISIVALLNNGVKKEKMHVMNTLISLIAILLIVQTRATVIIVVVSLILTVLVNSVRGDFSIKMKYLLSLPVIIVICIVAYFQLNLDKILLSIIENNKFSENEVSLTTRISGYKYYLECLSNNLVFGNGAFMGMGNDIATIKERGPYGIYYYVDVGLIGNLARFGAIILVPFISLFMSMIRGIIHSKNIALIFIVLMFFIQMITVQSYFYEMLLFPLVFLLSYFDFETNYQKGI